MDVFRGFKYKTHWILCMEMYVANNIKQGHSFNQKLTSNTNRREVDVSIWPNNVSINDLTFMFLYYWAAAFIHRNVQWELVFRSIRSRCVSCQTIEEKVDFLSAQFRSVGSTLYRVCGHYLQLRLQSFLLSHSFSDTTPEARWLARVDWPTQMFRFSAPVETRAVFQYPYFLEYTQP